MLPLDAQPLAVPRLLPACLGFVAGFIDACTFFALFHFFVAQVTGSFVIAGGQFVGLDKTMLAAVLASPIFFLTGMSTTLLLAWSGRTGWMALTAGLAVELALVVAFFVAGMIGAPFVYPNAPLAVASGLLGISAMGVQSALVRLLMHGVGSTNVMTSNSTQLAIDAAEWLIASHHKRMVLDGPSLQADYATLRARFIRLFSIMAGFRRHDRRYARLPMVRSVVSSWRYCYSRGGRRLLRLACDTPLTAGHPCRNIYSPTPER
jgi:uncharacterized membrane protein YoaK (UPF0700 family)